MEKDSAPAVHTIARVRRPFHSTKLILGGAIFRVLRRGVQLKQWPSDIVPSATRPCRNIRRVRSFAVYMKVRHSTYTALDHFVSLVMVP